jgi:hemerythrin
MQVISVNALFMKDHSRIGDLLQAFKETKHKNPEKSVQIFTQLKNALDKHFREEELLYCKYKYSNGAIMPMLNQIRDEHMEINTKINEIQNALKKGDITFNLDGFYELLEKHKKTEDEYLYPELDNVLSDKDKEEVYWKMKR